MVATHSKFTRQYFEDTALRSFTAILSCFPRHLEDVLRRPQCNNFSSSKDSLRRLQEVLKTPSKDVFKTLQDVFNVSSRCVCKTFSLKTSCKHVLKTSSKKKKCLQHFITNVSCVETNITEVGQISL